MILRLLIFLIFLSLESKLYSQAALPPKVYCANEETCVNTKTVIEENIVVEFSKGLAKITSYSKKNDILNTSIIRVTYSGAYHIIGDTIKVRLIAKWSDLRYRVPMQVWTTIPDASDTFIPHSNLSFVMKDNTLVPLNNFLPVLAISSEAAANELASQFDGLHSNIKMTSLLPAYLTKRNFTGNK